MTSISDKVSTLLFIGIVALPLLGLLIMNHQLTVANDITGAFIGAPEISDSNMVLSVGIVGMFVILLILYTATRIKHMKMVKTMPLAKINEEIKKIEEHLHLRHHNK